MTSLSGHDATCSHKTGLEINSLSINEQGSHAVLAGREIFKTVRVGGPDSQNTCSEDLNLQAIIRSRAATQKKQPPRIDIHDVAWAKGNYGNYMAAATANGSIAFYDLNRPDIEIFATREHNRQVHNVTFNPHAGYQLLSASQDGTVRMWDLRDLTRTTGTFTSRGTFSGRSDGVRDVKWSPENGVQFAISTDSGYIQKWDWYNMKAPLIKIAAHSTTCHTIDWHPDGKHLVSASADKTVKVWDFTADHTQQKVARWEIKTPHPVRIARWRPPCQSSMPGDQGKRQATQLATVYDRDNPIVHIWDFRRPLLPFREIECYNSAPTDLLWHSQDLLWTVGREGTFLQSDLKYTQKVVDKRHMQAFSVSPSGELAMVFQKRTFRPGAAPDRFGNQPLPPRSLTSDRLRNVDTERMSRGSADDNLDETFLSTSFNKKRHHTRTGSTRAHQSLGDTPPSHDGADSPILDLEVVLKRRKTFTPGQAAARGPVPGTTNALLFTYFAQKYKSRSYPEPPSVEDLSNINETFEKNAWLAQQASMYRMAQSWRIAGLAVKSQLHQRALRNRAARVLEGKHFSTNVPSDSPIMKKAREFLMDERRGSSKPATPMFRPLRNQDTQPHGWQESSSNVPTPLARPLPDTTGHAHNNGTALLDPDHDDTLALPPSLTPAPYIRIQALGDERVRSNGKLSLEGPSWHDSAQYFDERRAMISNWREQPKEPLNLESVSSDAVPMPPRLVKHDSSESFEMFPSVSDTRGASLPRSYAGNRSQLMDVVREELTGQPSSFDTQSSSGFISSNNEAAYIRSPAPRVTQRSSSGSAGSNVSVRSPTDTREGRDVMNAAMDVPHMVEPIGAKRDLSRQMETLAINNQQSFSSDSEVYTSGKGSLESGLEHGQDAENMETSGTIVPEAPRRGNRSRGTSTTHPPTLQHAVESAPAALPSKDKRDHHRLDPAKEPFLPLDFLVTHPSEDVAPGRPFALISMLRELLKYHTTVLSDAQTASYFLLLLTPLLPETHSLPQHEINATLATYSDCLANLGYTSEESYAIIQNSFEHMLKIGLQPLLAESVLSTYHEQLQAMGLLNNASYLRRLSYPTYPAVYEQGLKDNQMSLMCGNCHKAINNPNNKLRCETCGARQASCPVCWCEESPFESAPKKKKKHNQAPSHTNTDTVTDSIGGPETTTTKPNLYSTCLLCNHSSHAACMRAWHSADSKHETGMVSDGACPTPGCLCDCVEGPWRVEKTTRRKSEAARERVREDELKARPSRAVEVVRGGEAHGRRAGLMH